MKRFLTFLPIMALSIVVFTSCSAEKKPYPREGYSYCSYCGGTGYENYYLFGLFKDYCYACGGSGYAQNVYYDNMGGESNNPSFRGRNSLPSDANSDGFIPAGSVNLERVGSGSYDNFKLYTKRGAKYVLYYGNYIKVSGTGTVTIGSVSYRRI